MALTSNHPSSEHIGDISGIRVFAALPVALEVVDLV